MELVEARPDGSETGVDAASEAMGDGLGDGAATAETGAELDVAPVDSGPAGAAVDDGERSIDIEIDLDTTDFTECYLVHYRRLARALRLGGAGDEAAEDLAQEAFARALSRWRRISKGANPAGYVYVTAFRLLQRSLRRQSRWDVGDNQDQPVIRSMYSPADTAAIATTNVAIGTVLARMPARRRACAVMCLIVGLSVHDAGESLGIADGTVRKHLEEARKDFGEIQE